MTTTRLLIIASIVGAAGGAAVASPRAELEADRRAQIASMAATFDVAGGKADAMNALALDATVTCGRDPKLGLHAVAFVHERCTTSIPTSDEQLCRGAGLLALLQQRMFQLATGVDDSFAYQVTCAGYTLTGELMGRKGGYADGELNMKEVRTSDGAAIGAWSSTLPWDVQAPDASEPYFWAQALANRLPLVHEALNEVMDYVEHDDDAAEPRRAALIVELDRALDAIRAFPAIATDGGLQAAFVAYLADLKVNAEQGDLKRLVDRTTEPPARRKLRKRKKLKGADGVATVKLIASAQRALARKEQALGAAIEAFVEAHEQP